MLSTLREMKDEPKKYKAEDVIRLNVGGQRFDTFLGTLLADRTNDIYSQFIVLLEPELSNESSPPKDSDGAFFLDRDPEAFRILLNGLRFLVHSQHSQNGTVKSACSEEDLRPGKEAKGIWHRFRGK